MQTAALGRKASSASGYTLIEIAVVTLIVGILFLVGANAYKLYKIEQDTQKTELARIRVALAIDSFRERYGRYPCPSRYDRPRDHPDYGIETNCADTSIAPGTCANGVCIEISQRTVTRDDGTTFVPRVRRGAVPFRVLNLTEDEFYDAYGGRFSYAVSENLTNWQTFNVRHGGISVIDGQHPTSQALVEPQGSALYFLFSHGQDNVGAYDWNGNLIIPCDGPMFDAENCNTEEDSEAIYRVAKPSDDEVVLGGVVIPPTGPTPPVGPVNTHYDDFALFKGADATPLWRYSEINPAQDNVHDLTGEVVAIGAVTGSDMLMVNDRIRASGNIRGRRVCNGGGTDCFEPNFIAGTGDTCGTQHFWGIRTADLQCAGLPTIDFCPANEYLTGFNEDREPQCQPFLSTIYCDPTNVNLCSQQRTVGPRSPLNTIVTITAGASREQDYRCEQNGNSPNGRWVRRGSARGVCSCTASSTTVTNGATSCGTGYGGQTTTTTTTVCPSGQTTSTTNRAACVCQPGTETRTQNCPANHNGSITQSRNITCTGNTANVGPWTTTSNTCVCVNRAPQTQTLGCPAYHTGAITETRTWNTTSCSWNNWTQTSNTCTCQSTSEFRNQSCSAPQSGTIRQERVIQCPSATPGPWTTISNSCHCANRQETRQTACPNPNHVGAVTQQRTVDCYGNPVAGAAGNWSNTANTCAPPPTCQWMASTTLSPTTTGPEAGNNCACGTAPSNCRVRIGPGVFQGYQNCTCQ